LASLSSGLFDRKIGKACLPRGFRPADLEKIGSIVSGRKDVAYRGAILEHLIYRIKKASHNVR
jgi:hypothetical protein